MVCRECGEEIVPGQEVDVEEFKDLCYTCYSKKPKRVCVDFDGVLAEYDGWKGPGVMGSPRCGARKFLEELHGLGFKVVIHTTRNAGPIWSWLGWHDMKEYVHEVTSTKLPAVAYVDDRGLQFEGNFEDTLEELKAFAPYWKRPPERFPLTAIKKITGLACAYISRVVEDGDEAKKAELADYTATLAAELIFMGVLTGDMIADKLEGILQEVDQEVEDEQDPD